MNLDGVFYTQRAGIQAMRRSGGGSVISMASILGQVGFAMSSAYVAAKHGVLGMTKAAAWEHAVDGVRVNAVGPGFIMTPLLEANLDQPAIDFLANQHALAANGASRKAGRARGVVGHDASSFVTGAATGGRGLSGALSVPTVTVTAGLECLDWRRQVAKLATRTVRAEPDPARGHAVWQAGRDLFTHSSTKIH